MSAPALLCLPGPSFRYDLESGDLSVCGTPLFVKQEGGRGRGTAWCVWDAAVVVALWLDSAEGRAALEASGLPRSPRVVELGCGTGLAGLAAAAALPGAEVTLTDLPEALTALRGNLELNPLLQVNICELDWTQQPCSRTADLVLAADCVWLSHLVAPFVASLSALCGPRGLALLAHQSRSATVDDALWAALASQGFQAAAQPQPRLALCSQARVFLLTKAKPG